MLDPATWPLWLAITGFVIAAGVITVAGYTLAGVADRLADRTGMGEAVVGALLLGAGTSLPGILTSTVTAYNGYPQLAVSNAIGGLAAQTVFLVVADLSYSKANLEHAAASVPNIVNGTLLIVLLALILIAATLPPVTFFAVHPVSLVLIACYVFGLRMSRDVRDAPPWLAKQTKETAQDEPEEDDGDESMAALWGKFVGLLVVLGVAGFFVAKTGEGAITRFDLSGSVVGATFTSVTTSLPELVTAVAAVRRGALTLAVSDIIGGNAFDTLFCGAADLAYRDGSIYHAVQGTLGRQEQFLIAVTILMTATLVLGLVRREKSGIGNIGFESIALLGIYAATIATLIFAF